MDIAIVPPDFKDIVTTERTAVLVVDMQHDFCSPGGALAQLGTDMSSIDAIVPKLKTFITEARRRQVKIISIWMERDSSDISLPHREIWRRHNINVQFCQSGSWGAKLVPGLEPEAGDFTVCKKRYSAFIGTDLDERLHALGITTLVVTGVATNICVESTCRDGFMMDYYIIVPEDLVASNITGHHAGALENINRYFGRVVTSDVLLQAWDGS